ncbi:MAG: SHOCT domain-containing protein [Acidimicrobiales bacterium]
MMVFGPLVMLFGFVVVVLAVFVVLRFFGGGTGGNAIRPSSGTGSRRENLEAPRDQRDPIDIVRERYARGEIDHDELERYLHILVVDGQPRRSVGDPPG